MAMSETSAGVREVVEALAAVVGRLDVAVLSGSDAAELTGLFARGERLCATAKVMTARRAAECQHWARTGARSPEQWLASVSGESERSARASLVVAEQIEARPELAEACVAGQLSVTQASEIAAAAQVDPDATGRLVDGAARQGLRRLRESCRQVVTAGRSEADDRARRAAIHRSRYLRTWMDRDGAGRLDARLTPEALASFQACLRPFQTEQFHAARQAGQRERPECYAADALVALAAVGAASRREAGSAGRMASTGPGEPGGEAPREPRKSGVEGRRLGPPAMVVAVVDHAALVRGHVRDGESCVIKGVGPVPVATVRAMLDDAFLAALVSDGIAISSVVHMGRRPTAAQWTALWVRDRSCVVPGCDTADGLEAHHLGGGWSATRTTSLDDLVLLCAHHHDLASYQGWTLTGPPGQWDWHPPPGGVPPGPLRRRRPQPPTPVSTLWRPLATSETPPTQVPVWPAAGNVALAPLPLSPVGRVHRPLSPVPLPTSDVRRPASSVRGPPPTVPGSGDRP
jgi:hypothetical protein